MKIRLMTMMFCVLAMTTAIFAQDSIPPNGSFERPADRNIGAFTTLNAGPLHADIYHWEINHPIDWIDSYWQASQGHRSIDLNAFAPGSMTSDKIVTTPGLTYQVTFDMSGNPDSHPAAQPEFYSPSDKTMNVSIDGGAQTQAYHYNTSCHHDEFGVALGNCNTREDMKWMMNTYTFKATASETRLTFASTTIGAFGPALDNVNTTVITAFVCHRDKGKPGQKTIAVGLGAVPAHIAHGDSEGPCPVSQ